MCPEEYLTVAMNPVPRDGEVDDTQCPQCGAAQVHGHWQWNAGYRPSVPSILCPACLRIASRTPAGEILLSGPFVRENAREIEGIAATVEACGLSRHPLERLMTVTRDHSGQIAIATTGTMLARDIVEAVDARFNGRVDLTYTADGSHVFIHWSRASQRNQTA